MPKSKPKTQKRQQKAGKGPEREGKEAKREEEEEDLGRKFASHWTAAENANQPLSIPVIEAARAGRRKHYATIAKECAPLSLPSPFPSLPPPQSPVSSVHN